MPSPTQTLYFAYGSNLWLHQMSIRCPSSPFVGLAILKNYNWIISHRGYANVVLNPAPTPDTSPYVWGMLYTLSPKDEANLDENEGVPYDYQKVILPVDAWMAGEGGQERLDSITLPPQRKRVLVYVDHIRIEEGSPKMEYIYRMNRGLEDALRVGVPREWVERVIRRFIPEDSESGAEGKEEVAEMERLALKQAAGFVEEEKE